MATTWLTDPESALLVDLDLATQARVLRAATPVRGFDGRVHGADYLLGVQRALAEHGLSDPGIDALVALVG